MWLTPHSNRYCTRPGSRWPAPDEMSPTMKPVFPNGLKRLIWGRASTWPGEAETEAGKALPAASAVVLWKKSRREIPSIIWSFSMSPDRTS